MKYTEMQSLVRSKWLFPVCRAVYSNHYKRISGVYSQKLHGTTIQVKRFVESCQPGIHRNASFCYTRVCLFLKWPARKTLVVLYITNPAYSFFSSVFKLTMLKMGSMLYDLCPFSKCSSLRNIDFSNGLESSTFIFGKESGTSALVFTEVEESKGGQSDFWHHLLYMLQFAFSLDSYSCFTIVLNLLVAYWQIYLLMGIWKCWAALPPHSSRGYVE